MDRTRVGEKCDAGEKCGRLGCVVMANGEARRFGRQKLLEPLHGKAVVLHALDALVREFWAHPGCVTRLAWHGEAGSPVVFPGALASALCALSGDVGGGALLRRDAELARGVHLVEARRAAELMDVDTPEDLARVAGELGRLARSL